MLADPKKIITAETKRLYSPKDFEAFGLLAFALHDWETSAFLDAGPLLETFLQGDPPAPDKWINNYKPLAKLYFADYKLIAPIELALPTVKRAADAQSLLSQVRKARASLSTSGRITDRLDIIEKILIAKGATS